MNDIEFDTSDISMSKSIRGGIKSVLQKFKPILRATFIMSVITAILLAVTLGGNIGVVNIDYLTYVPYHFVSEVQTLLYIIGIFCVVVAFIVWRGNIFSVLGTKNAETGIYDVSGLKFKDYRYGSLRFLQFCLLAFIVFGIIAVALVFASLKVTAWLWILAAAYLIFISVPVYMASYEYMLNDDSNFRKALKLGFRAVKEQWGRVFFRLLVVNFVASVLIIVCFLPSFALLMSIYDNAVAVAMGEGTATPLFIYMFEYLALALSTLVSLFIVFVSMSVLCNFFNDAKKYSANLAAARAEDM